MKPKMNYPTEVQVKKGSCQRSTVHLERHPQFPVEGGHRTAVGLKRGLRLGHTEGRRLPRRRDGSVTLHGWVP